MLVKVEVYQEDDMWCARGIGHDIFTQGQTVDELFRNIREAVALHFENRAGVASVSWFTCPIPF